MEFDAGMMRHDAGGDIASFVYDAVFSRSTDPLVMLAGFDEVVKALQVQIRNTAHDARQDGASWTEIGAALGISKQAAAKRFGGGLNV